MADNEAERQAARDLGLDDEVLERIKASVPSPLARLTLEGAASAERFDRSRFTGRVEPAEEEGGLALGLDVL